VKQLISKFGGKGEAMIERISGASIWLYALPFVKACSYDWGGKRNHHEKNLGMLPTFT
jgi:hypothetical protein